MSLVVADSLGRVDDDELVIHIVTNIESQYRRGDCNDDGEVDISDAVATLSVLFLGQGVITCQDAADSNDDGVVDISDAVATLGVLFLGQDEIPLPGMHDCGPDPPPDELGCVSFPSCSSS